MDEKPLKKSYFGLIIWIIVYCGACTAAVFLPVSEQVILRLINVITMVGLCVLTAVIYKTEYVYWYSGITYEQAAAAGSQRRKEYAGKHLRIFWGLSALFIIFTIIMQLLGFNALIDEGVMIFGILAAAIRTMFYRL